MSEATNPDQVIAVSHPATDYNGYAPKDINDFDIEEEQDPGSINGTSGHQFDRLSDPNLPRDEPKAGWVPLVALVVALVLFVVFLIIGASVPCIIGLCGKLDRSSTTGSQYNFAAYDIEAPLQYAWGALTVFLFGVAVVSLFSVMIKKKGTGDAQLTDVAAFVRKGSEFMILNKLKYLIVVLGCLFILVGVSYNMRAAGCFAVGVLTSVISCWINASVGTRGSLRVAAAAKESSGLGVQVALRAGTTVVLVQYTFAVGGIAFAYLVFRDVRALSGFAIGTITVALFFRLCGGIYAKSSNIGRNFTVGDVSGIPRNDRNNPASIAGNIGDIVGKVVGESAHFLACYTTAIAATCILGSSFPYFKENSYALCVFNHLLLDQTCIGYTEPTVKVAFSATICRINDFHKNYPLLELWQSNSVFVALPFMLGFLGLIATALSTAYRSTPKNAYTPAEEDKTESRMKPFLLRIKLNVMFAVIISLVCTIGSCWGLFGKASGFYKANSTARSRYDLPVLTPSNANTRCRPLDIQGSDQDKLPALKLVSGQFRFLDSFGLEFPRVTETAWRLFLCAMLGVFLGLALGFATEYTSSLSYSPSHRVAENGEYGDAAVLVEGIGVSLLATFGSFVTVFVSMVSCYNLFGAFGIGIAALGMLSIYGPIAALSAFDAILRNAEGFTAVSKGSFLLDKDNKAFRDVGKIFSAMAKAILNAAFALSVVAILFVLIQESNLTPSPRQLGGTLTGKPTRHITSLDESSLTDMYVLVSTLIGLFIPFFFCAVVVFGISRVSQSAIGYVHGQVAEMPNLLQLRSSVGADFRTCNAIISNGSIIESILPGMVAILPPFIIGFGFGQRALIGMLVGILFCGFILSVALSASGGVWEAATGLVENEVFGEEHGNDSRWHRAMLPGRALGQAFSECLGPCLTLLIATSCSVSIVVIPHMQRDKTNGWIGLIVLIAALLVGGFTMICVSQRGWKTEDGADGRGKVDGAYEAAPLLSAKVNRRVVSPFCEEGPSILRDHISPRSQLGVARVDVTENPDIVI